MSYQIGDTVRDALFEDEGVITEIRPLGYYITGMEPEPYVRLRPGLDWIRSEFEAKVASGRFVIVPKEA